jgi:predicted nucleotidyltransferase
LHFKLELATFDNLTGLWNYLEDMYHTKIDLLHKHKRSKGAIFESIQKEVIYG